MSKCYQVDQSGKVEQTNKNTVVAICNGSCLSVLIKSRDKILLQKYFRQENSEKLFPCSLFSLLVALLINKLSPKHKVQIDTEYVGKNSIIESMIIEYLRTFGDHTKHQIDFVLVGKKSTAHKLAYGVNLKKIKPDLIIDVEKIVKLLITKKRIGISLYPRKT